MHAYHLLTFYTIDTNGKDFIINFKQYRRRTDGRPPLMAMAHQLAG